MHFTTTTNLLAARLVLMSSSVALNQKGTECADVPLVNYSLTRLSVKQTGVSVVASLRMLLAYFHFSSPDQWCCTKLPTLC